VEFIIIIGVMLSILSILVYSMYSSSIVHQNQISVVKANDVINELQKACELVYNEGTLAKTKIFVHVPSNVVATSASNTKIEMNVSVSGNTLSVHRKLKFNVQGTIPSKEGYYWINVTSKGTYVLIG
jgi:Tfp pilus assembly protein PilE